MEFPGRVDEKSLGSSALAEYLKTNSPADLHAVLDDGVPPEEHPKFDLNSHAPTPRADGSRTRPETGTRTRTADPRS